jgi:hypothetical protein
MNFLKNKASAALNKTKGAGAPKKKTKEEERLEAEAKKAEAEALKIEKAAARNEALLPWSLEQKVAMFLNPIKIPILIVVAILGSWVEYNLIATPHQTWVAPLWRSGPTCFVNKLDGPLLNDTRLDRLSSLLNKTLYPIIDRINKSLGNHTNVTEEGNRRFSLLDYGTLVHFPVDHCGITDDCQLETDENGKPTLDIYGGENETTHDPLESIAGVAKWRVPFVTYSLLWAIYKFCFLPFHPIDRAYRLVLGNPHPPPEPVFKLLTEPYFQGCGGMNLVLNKFSMVGKIIRYSLLPNSLLLPIISLRQRKRCPGFVHYTYDTWLGGFIYFFILADLVSVFVAFAVGITVMGSKCISTPFYRIYKFIWYAWQNVALVFFIVDIFIVLNLRFWEGIHLQIRLFFTIVLSPNLTIDFLQILGGASIFFDTLQFTIMVLSFLCPVLLQKIPGMAGLMKDDSANLNQSANRPDGVASTRSEEAQPLVNARNP